MKAADAHMIVSQLQPNENQKQGKENSMKKEKVKTVDGQTLLDMLLPQSLHTLAGAAKRRIYYRAARKSSNRKAQHLPVTHYMQLLPNDTKQIGGFISAQRAE